MSLSCTVFFPRYYVVLACVTAIILEQSFSSVKTIEMIAHVGLRFVICL